MKNKAEHVMGNIKIIVKVKDDYDISPSEIADLGSYASKCPHEWFVDRQTGTVYGEWYEEFVTVDYQETDKRRIMIQPKGFFYLSHIPKGWHLYTKDVDSMAIGRPFFKQRLWVPELDAIGDQETRVNESMLMATNHATNGGQFMVVEADDSIYLNPDLQDVEDNEDGTYTVQLAGNRKIGDIHTRYERNGYRYVELGSNHIPPGKGWDHVDQATKDKVIAKMGSFEAQDIAYAIQDAQRLENFGHSWNYMWMSVELRHIGTGATLAYASLGGIESDSGDEYIAGEIKAMLVECWTQLRDNNSAIVAFAQNLIDTMGKDLPDVDEVAEEIAVEMDL